MLRHGAISFFGVFSLAFLLLAVGCKKTESLGSKIPSDIPVVTLSSIMANASEYNGKTVILKGTIAGQCPSLCEFFLKEGTESATVFPQGYKLPKLETGKRVTIHAQVTAGSENVVLSALGLRME